MISIDKEHKLDWGPDSNSNLEVESELKFQETNKIHCVVYDEIITDIHFEAELKEVSLKSKLNFRNTELFLKSWMKVGCNVEIWSSKKPTLNR